MYFHYVAFPFDTEQALKTFKLKLSKGLDDKSIVKV